MFLFILYRRGPAGALHEAGGPEDARGGGVGFERGHFPGSNQVPDVGVGEQLGGGVGVLNEGGEVLGVGHEADDGIGVEVCDLVGVVRDLEGVELEDLVDDLDELVLVEEVELVPVCVDQGVDVVEGAVEAVGEGAEAGAAFMSETVE